MLAFFPFDTEVVELPGKTKVGGLKVCLSGQLLDVAYRHPGHTMLVFQIVFHPTGLFRLLGIPSFELNNSFLDGELVMGRGVTEMMNERLAEATSYEHMVTIGDQFVHNLYLKKCNSFVDPIDKVSLTMIESDNNLSLDWLATQSCLSIRQFQRKFEERAGINPKLFHKINRFDRAFRLKNRFPEKDWLEIACHCGYTDYQHMAKDYKVFTGKTPVEFHRLEDQAPERAAGLGNEFYKTSVK